MLHRKKQCGFWGTYRVGFVVHWVLLPGLSLQAIIYICNRISKMDLCQISHFHLVLLQNYKRFCPCGFWGTYLKK